ncbi:hypothetical protein [Streptomyces pseudovenezuelae]
MDAQSATVGDATDFLDIDVDDAPWSTSNDLWVSLLDARLGR